MSNLIIKRGFAAGVGELFAEGTHAGLIHNQLISVLQSQLELEQRLPRDLKPLLKAAMDNRHKPTAEKVPA